ncbi:MAG: hypothetical protein KDE33_24920 [Bacteroidetes bacterium]|nr:hypothetical protein [Bacteroidota bacterium]
MSIEKIVDLIFTHGTSFTSVLFIVGIIVLLFSFLIYLYTIGIALIGKADNVNKVKAEKLSKILAIAGTVLLIIGGVFVSFNSSESPEGDSTDPIRVEEDCVYKKDIVSTLNLVKNTLAKEEEITPTSKVILESYENQFTQYIRSNNFCQDEKMINNSIEEISYIKDYINRKI